MGNLSIIVKVVRFDKFCFEQNVSPFVSLCISRTSNLEFFTRALIKFVLAFMEANLYPQKPTIDKKISCLLLFLRFETHGHERLNIKISI